MKNITIKTLEKACKELIDAGLGDKEILITSDDEGNNYHTLFYLFTTDIDDIKICKDAGLFHDNNDVNDVVLLG